MAAPTAAAIPINSARLWQTLDVSATIGAIAGNGLGRLALSEADAEMRRQFIEWSEQAELTVSIDRIGNIFARRAGRDEAAAPVALGSHLDTQVHGGRFDGVLGVLAGLEVCRALDDAGIETERPLEVISWTDEEGARFHRAMLGSSVFAGQLELDAALALRDEHGVSVAEALAARGCGGETPVPGHALHAYLELHIEQAALLDQRGIDVGIVDGTYPIQHVDVRFRGRTAHSGPTPMPERRSALTAAAHAIVAVDRIARAHPPDAKSTTSTIRVWPNRSGIIASEADLRFDFRHPDRRVVEQMAQEIERALAEAAAAGNVDVELLGRTRFGDAPFDPEVVSALDAAAAALGVPAMRMRTQAGHDALVVAEVAPAAMVFCPCRDGITHHPDEEIDTERTLPAVRVLAEAALRLAGRADG